MPTRRQTALGLGSMALGSAVVSSASFLSDTAAAADLRVVVASELTLTPGRAGEEYVGTDDDEVTEIVIEKLNQRSISRFEDLVEVTNNGDVPYDRLEFSFSATGEDSESSDVAETLRVVSADDVSTETNGEGQTTLLADSGETFDTGDTVTFGIVVNLIADDSPGGLEELSDPSSVALEIAGIDEE